MTELCKPCGEQLAQNFDSSYDANVDPVKPTRTHCQQT
ncbi:hypothetical protein JCM19235_4219 [Vibrio maritimus]|uniref:Uncharacterized protein n=1 Tax=Vibrio maritimus TaxID=990268 RepID=A0A090S0M5_9VIBR|nr:hypothetical protein JCM19235_4219 [Vibrio maritimus]